MATATRPAPRTEHPIASIRAWRAQVREDVDTASIAEGSTWEAPGDPGRRTETGREAPEGRRKRDAH